MAACRSTASSTPACSTEHAEQHPLWAKELFGHASHRPESEEYGIESSVYRARRPFDPARLHRTPALWQELRDPFPSWEPQPQAA